MSHIHLPDGSVPILWCIGGFVLCFLLMVLAIRRVKAADVKKKIPYIGIVAALMLIIMNIPMGILPIHLSLAVLSGILAGPELGFIAVFVVNVIIALMGHGGITLVGINTIILGAELITGSFIYRILVRRLKCIPSSVISVVLAIIVSTSLLFGIASLTVGTEQVFITDHDHEHAIVQTDVTEPEEHHEGSEAEEVKWLSMTGWTAISVILLIGITIEALVTAGIVSFFNKVRPDLVSFEAKS